MAIYPPERVLPNGVKQTTGGTFNPNDSQTYFIAGACGDLTEVNYPSILVAVNELRTSKERDKFDRLLDMDRKVFLDSGIFNLAMEHVRTHGTSHDDALRMAPEEIDGFDKLWDDYAEIVTTYGDRLWGAVELDQGGVTNKPRTRARIEKELGIVPVPVYHPLLDGWDYYDDLAGNYDRICFGNIVQASTQLRLRLVHTAMERARKYPYLWTHLLGLGPSQMLNSLRMRGSLDSSGWLALVRWPDSWKGAAMGNATTRYGSDMWMHSATYFEGAENYPKGKNNQTSIGIPISYQGTLDSILADTHSDYSGRYDNEHYSS